MDNIPDYYEDMYKMVMDLAKKQGVIESRLEAISEDTKAMTDISNLHQAKLDSLIADVAVIKTTLSRGGGLDVELDRYEKASEVRFQEMDARVEKYNEALDKSVARVDASIQKLEAVVAELKADVSKMQSAPSRAAVSAWSKVFSVALGIAVAVVTAAVTSWFMGR